MWQRMDFLSLWWINILSKLVSSFFMSNFQYWAQHVNRVTSIWTFSSSKLKIVREAKSRLVQRIMTVLPCIISLKIMYNIAYYIDGRLPSILILLLRHLWLHKVQESRPKYIIVQPKSQSVTDMIMSLNYLQQREPRQFFPIVLHEHQIPVDNLICIELCQHQQNVAIASW